MKNVILIVLLLLANKLFAQYPPFDTLDYTNVVVYEYYGDGKNQLLIVENGKLTHPTTKKVELSQEQVTSIIQVLGSESTYGGDKAYCFIPRMGIVFYNQNEIVAHISICLQCNYLISSLDIPAKEMSEIDKGKYKYKADGFSSLGKKSLMDFCEELGFENCKK